MVKCSACSMIRQLFFILSSYQTFCLVLLRNTHVLFFDKVTLGCFGFECLCVMISLGLFLCMLWCLQKILCLTIDAMKFHVASEKTATV